MHRFTILSFASSKSPFEQQLGSRETSHAPHLETEVRRSPRRNPRRAARAAWVRCRPSILRHDPKTNELTRSCRRRVQLFLLSHYRSGNNRACLPGTLCNSGRKGATRSVQVHVSKNLESGTQFHCEQPPSSTSRAEPSWSTRGSEADPTTSSRYSSFHGRERSLDPGMLKRAWRHSRINGALPVNLHRPSDLGSDLRRDKQSSVFRFHTASVNKDRPKHASHSTNQWFSRSGILRPSLLWRWQLTCLRTIGLPPPQHKLERDRWSARWLFFRQRNFRQTVKDQGEDVHGAHFCSALPFKSNHLLASYPSGYLSWPVLPTNFIPDGARARTTRIRMSPSL